MVPAIRLRALELGDRAAGEQDVVGPDRHRQAGAGGTAVVGDDQLRPAVQPQPGRAAIAGVVEDGGREARCAGPPATPRRGRRRPARPAAAPRRPRGLPESGTGAIPGPRPRPGRGSHTAPGWPRPSGRPSAAPAGRSGPPGPAPRPARRRAAAGDEAPAPAPGRPAAARRRRASRDDGPASAPPRRAPPPRPAAPSAVRSGTASQAEPDVVGDVEVREQQVVLEDHADPPPPQGPVDAEGGVGEGLAVDPHDPASGRSSPAISRSRLVLPTPEGPKTIPHVRTEG